jgi:hypothetical protein
LFNLLATVVCFSVAHVRLIARFSLVAHCFCAYLSIFSFRRRMMRLVYDCCCCYRFGCADCGFGSWIDHVKVIIHDHFEIACRDSGQGCRIHNFCFVGLEDRGDLFFYAGPVSPFVRLLQFTSEYGHHVDYQGGLPNYHILVTNMLVGIRARLMMRKSFCFFCVMS